MSFALVGVTFWEGARIAAVAIAFYYLAVTVLQPQPLISILYQSAWMLTTTVFAALGFYFLDRTQRIAWLRQLDLISAQEQIRSLLHNVLPRQLPQVARDRFDRALKAVGIAPDRRPQTLSVEEWLALHGELGPLP